MPSNIPDQPSSPFDASGLTDEQLFNLSYRQRVWADMTDEQHMALSDHEGEKVQPVSPPHEGKPQYIPTRDELAKVHRLFQWVDGMHDHVRRPYGMAWAEIELMLASLRQLMEWAESNPPIDPRYRYRIDAPMDPDAKAPDHLPKDW